MPVKITKVTINPTVLVKLASGKLAKHWKDDVYSSARFYVKNKLSGFVPVHYQELG
jgi:hypothetical protein